MGLSDGRGGSDVLSGISVDIVVAPIAIALLCRFRRWDKPAPPTSIFYKPYLIGSILLGQALAVTSLDILPNFATEAIVGMMFVWIPISLVAMFLVPKPWFFYPMAYVIGCFSICLYMATAAMYGHIDHPEATMNAGYELFPLAFYGGAVSIIALVALRHLSVRKGPISTGLMETRIECQSKR